MPDVELHDRFDRRDCPDVTISQAVTGQYLDFEGLCKLCRALDAGERLMSFS